MFVMAISQRLLRARTGQRGWGRSTGRIGSTKVIQFARTRPRLSDWHNAL